MIEFLFLLTQLFFFFNWSFKIVLFLLGLKQKKVEYGNPKFYPDYHILLPAYKESNVISELISNLRKLDYPKDKINVYLILEQDDIDSIRVAKTIENSDNFFKTIILPNTQPKTKPKACNYTLEFIKPNLTPDSIVTIYDAEDKPETDQLKKVVYLFENSEKNVACIQAKLNYFNKKQNTLTSLFTIEYTYWFDFLLPGLDKAKLPIPLGGTSNHFKANRLIEVGAWDSYNVTEDAELGIKLYSLGYKTLLVDSTTWEEACSKIIPWIKQRTRWTKGYWLTYLKYLRMRKKLSLWDRFGILFFVGLTPIVNVLYIPLNILMVIFYFYSPFNFSKELIFICHINFFIGTSCLVISNALSSIKRKNYDLILIAGLLPFYWVLHSIAAARAFKQSITDPYGWEKTPHGLK